MTLNRSTGLKNLLLGININMLTNPGFDSVTTGWTASTATLSSVASGQTGNCLQVAESGGASAAIAYQDVGTIIGHLYKFSGYF